MKGNHTPGKWMAVLDAPGAAIKGHLVKERRYPHCPLAVLAEGGGTKGKPMQVANARLIAATPELLALVEDFAERDPCQYDGDLCRAHLCVKPCIHGRATRLLERLEKELA